MRAEIKFIPEGQYTSKDLETLVREMKVYLEGTKEVMHREETAEFLGMSVWNVDKMVRKGELKSHMLGTTRLFLRSEILEKIKNS